MVFYGEEEYRQKEQEKLCRQVTRVHCEPRKMARLGVVNGCSGGVQDQARAAVCKARDLFPDHILCVCVPERLT